MLLKPAPRALAAQLWVLKNEVGEVPQGLADVVHLASTGRTSLPADQSVPKALYLAAGFRVCGERAVRVDILERLADLIRPAIAYRPGVTPGTPPPGTADDDGFVVTVNMTSLAGCSGEAFASILTSLGYHKETRKGPAITAQLVPEMPKEPVKPIEAVADPEASSGEGSGEEVSDEASAAVLHDAEPAEVAERQAEAQPADADADSDRQSGEQWTALRKSAKASRVFRRMQASIRLVRTKSGRRTESPLKGSPYRRRRKPFPPYRATARWRSARRPRASRRLSTRKPPQSPQKSSNSPRSRSGSRTRHQHGGQRQNRERGSRPHQGRKGKDGGESAPKTPRVFVIPPAPERPKQPERPSIAEGEQAATAPGGEQRPPQRREGRPDRPRFEGPRPAGHVTSAATGLAGGVGADRGGAELRQFASTEKPRGRDKQPDPGFALR